MKGRVEGMDTYWEAACSSLPSVPHLALGTHSYSISYSNYQLGRS